ncbi:PREDICTED: uncharacterized protein LOC109150785 [Ipomoea nil]|uniref:uncharacterized protein LOC109150785 n=1 Tax=Ipomoea nil TaxID=35883 RepID=UPI0009008633|nr:PREDICTED: uncharacterized protein LOC109150785 [Ipomoea nil]
MSQSFNPPFDITPIEPLTGGLKYKRWVSKVMMLLESNDVDYVIFEDPEKFVESAVQSPAQTAIKDTQATSDGSTASKSTTTPTAPTSNSTQAALTSQTSRTKYEKDNKTARAKLQRVSNPLFDMFSPHRSAKLIWEFMKEKYGVDDCGRRKYAVNRWLHFTMTEAKQITEQVHDFENLVADMKAEGAVVNDAFLGDALVDKLPDSWLDFKNKSKHELKHYTLKQLINTINIKEENRMVNKSGNFPDSLKANVVETTVGLDRPKSGEYAKNQKKGSKSKNSNRIKTGKI